ncbi:DUF2442 domain-containing protein [Spirosoma sp. HMF4905]|uniref:DUF2442 domain-containing protein n=1 Tax=Spirosoma arboris TaxID=2682092 RepID=A0A7K1SET9_9BACT|nr:DUF2442 domain-containing protein [Spirosoma arboris]MVM32116.1 DUF2442 domain-containing protein [Spirosoma arboris]
MVSIKQQVEGYWNVVPKVQSICFPTPNQLKVELADGRAILMPLDRFPSIQKLTAEQRQCWYVYGNGFSFDDADEVIHIEQILGNFDTYRHEP